MPRVRTDLLAVIAQAKLGFKDAGKRVGIQELKPVVQIETKEPRKLTLAEVSAQITRELGPNDSGGD